MTAKPFPVPWTTGEIRLMKQMHDCAKPRLADLYAAFPRHTPAAVRKRAQDIGLRKPRGIAKQPTRAVKWRRFAQDYFARRAAGLLQ